MSKELQVIEKDARDYLFEMKKSLAGYAMRTYNQNRFLKSAMLAMVENPALMGCLQSPAGKASLFNALRHAATLGLSLNPQEGKSCLIGYRRKDGTMVVNYQVMKNGFVELAMASGKVRDIGAFTIRENDTFDNEKGPETDSYKFKSPRKNRGKIDGFFVYVKFKDGVVRTDYMPIDEVEDHRERYGKNLYDDKRNPRKDHAWFKSFEGMGLKTVIKRLFRSGVKISDEVTSAVGSDDEFEGMTIELEKDKGFSAEDLKTELDKKKIEPPEKPQQKPKQKKENPQAKTTEDMF